ncbi:MAG: nicotinate (nicotinamide) nucleotide adenylyltransferase, partial [Planctomycetia bacterium]
GSFDPVHTGHLIAAECCREQAGLDRVIFMPAAVPPHKQNHHLSAAEHGVTMLRLAIGGNDAFSVSTDELDRGGISYTVETLDRLRSAHHGDEILLILGPDAIREFPTWREPERILGMADVLIMERATLDDAEALLKDQAVVAVFGSERLGRVVATRVRLPAIGIRACDLRAAIAAGRSVRYRTPRAVEQYILTNGLYRPT